MLPRIRASLVSTLLSVSAVAASVSCTSGEHRAASANAAEGHALLDEYAGVVGTIAQSSRADPGDEMLAENEAHARELDAAGKLTPEFRDRHRRLVEVTRAVLTPPQDAAERQRIATELAALAAAVDSPAPALTDGLAGVAPLIVEELLSLHMLLDGERNRDAARTKYFGADGRP